MKQKLYRVSAYGIVLLFLSISFFSSCSKEDNIAPVITSVNFKMNDTIRNIFNIKVDATDNTGIDRLELLANDSLIGQVNEAPFEYLWNTTEMKDGQYVLRSIIYDSNGNKAEKADRKK